MKDKRKFRKKKYYTRNKKINKRKYPFKKYKVIFVSLDDTNVQKKLEKQIYQEYLKNISGNQDYDE